MMEKIVETFVKSTCEESSFEYMTQANAKEYKNGSGESIYKLINLHVI